MSTCIDLTKESSNCKVKISEKDRMSTCIDLTKESSNCKVKISEKDRMSTCIDLTKESSNCKVKISDPEEYSDEEKQKLFEDLIKKTEHYSQIVKHLNSDNSSSSTNENSIENNSKVYNCKFEKTPDYIKYGEMRDYQIAGLNWMISLYENKINGILADDMGLGKTLQAISLIGYVKYVKNLTSAKFLIIAPKTVSTNWVNELTKWCPSLKIIFLFGEKPERKKLIKNKVIASSNWDVCLTGYSTVYIEHYALRQINWNCVILDEGHKIKNESTLISRIIRRLNSKFSLILTGTPLQNNLHELWALFNYLLPNLFERTYDFNIWFDKTSCLEAYDNNIERLHLILRPFILRRTKSEVEKNLLPKIETKIMIGLTKIQINIYRNILVKNLNIFKGNDFRNQPTLRHVIQALRKCVDHPYILIDSDPVKYHSEEYLVNSCGKMIVLDKLLKKLKLEKSRVLIFCQLKSMLDSLEDFCCFRKYEYSRIDGETPLDERQELIDEYNMKNSIKFIFMISTRAGGLGINLQTADSVILYSPDWNPQMDLQAIDRAHRIGQTKQVRVFRFFTTGTIEQKIDKTAVGKLELDYLVVQKFSKSQNEYSLERIKEVFQCNKQNLNYDTDGDNIDKQIDAILSKCAQISINNQNENLSTYMTTEMFSAKQNVGLFKKNMADNAKSNNLLDVDDFMFNYGENWTNREYELFLAAIEKYGPYDLINFAKILDKELCEIFAFHNSFYSHYLKLKNFEQINSLLERGKEQMKTKHELKIALEKKMSQKYSYFDFKLLYGNQNESNDMENDDKLLIYLIHSIGFENENLYDELKKPDYINLYSSKLRRKLNSSLIDLERHCYILMNLIFHDSESVQSEILRPSYRTCSDIDDMLAYYSRKRTQTFEQVGIKKKKYN